mmetsp:Transcript_10464/g.21777  ORF Transcript_10464/g.21777 Transcript_10464/m.21777 type:complete len:295 (+) Transcript_10464:611-1495(+)
MRSLFWADCVVVMLCLVRHCWECCVDALCCGSTCSCGLGLARRLLGVVVLRLSSSLIFRNRRWFSLQLSSLGFQAGNSSTEASHSGSTKDSTKWISLLIRLRSVWSCMKGATGSPFCASSSACHRNSSAMRFSHSLASEKLRHGFDRSAVCNISPASIMRWSRSIFTKWRIWKVIWRFLWWLFMSVARMALQIVLRSTLRLRSVKLFRMFVSLPSATLKVREAWWFSRTEMSLYRRLSTDQELMWYVLLVPLWSMSWHRAATSSAKTSSSVMDCFSIGSAATIMKQFWNTWKAW